MFSLGFPIWAQNFTNAKLRIDIELSGSRDSCHINVITIVKEPFYSGSSNSYIDKFEYGEFACELIDQATSQLIYSNGFSSLFNEWQLMNPTARTPFVVGKTLNLPYPTKIATFNIYQLKNGVKTLINTTIINPFEIKNSNTTLALQAKKVYYKGDYKKHLDILIMGDGFAQKDITEFEEIARSFADSLLIVPPFSTNKNHINFWSICPIEHKSGIEYSSGSTTLGCRYNTLESDRYLYSLKNQSIANISANTPYDQIIILVNSSKYGGGGIYNDFAVAAAGGEKNFDVMIHEFGHSFAGLGDEYSYDAPTDSITYLKEPWEPNLTYLIDFKSKWKDMVDPKAPLPTPDSLSHIVNVGVFEGGGYQTKGVYRPSYNCRMRTTNVNYFCEVCKRAIDEKIKSYVNFDADNNLK